MNILDSPLSDDWDFSADESDDPVFKPNEEYEGGSSSASSISNNYKPDGVKKVAIPHKHTNASNAKSLPSEFSVSENENTPPLSRKRQRKPENWKRNINKIKRQAGESYMNTNLNMVSAKVMKPPCKHTCFYHCTEYFTEDNRKHIFNMFWALSDDEKRNFYFKFVKRNPVKRRRVNDSEAKQYSYMFYFQMKDQVHRVCRMFFMNTLNIDQKRIYHCFTISDNVTGTPLTIKRGCHVKYKIPLEKIDIVKKHINSFPRVQSHYCRANSSKTYYEAELNLNKMFLLYKEDTVEPVKIHMYRQIFNNEFNISFHRPKKDQCNKCAIFKNIEKPSENEESDHKAHVLEKNAAKAEKDMDRNNFDQQHCVICYDMQSVFNLPKGNASMFYYKRKLNVYNMTATVLIPQKTKVTYCALWTEMHSGRTGNDIASALIKILTKVQEDNPEIRRYTLWSDSCVPQNKNKINSTALKIYMKNYNIKTIHQKFSVPGHSLIQEVDSVHGVIDRHLKHMEIHSPLHLVKLLTNMNYEKTKLKVLQMIPNDFKVYSSIAEQLNYTTIPFNKVKIILYENNAEFVLKYKTTVTDIEYSVCSIIKTPTKKFLKTPKNIFEKHLSIMSSKDVDKNKKQDIKDLMPFLPKADQAYFDTLFKKSI